MRKDAPCTRPEQDPDRANPTHDTDESGNNTDSPAPAKQIPFHHPDNYLSIPLTPDEEQEVFEYQMLHQDEQDGLFPDTEPYPEYNQPFRSEVSYLKDMMGYLLGQLKVDNNFTVVDFDNRQRRLQPLQPLTQDPPQEIKQTQ